MKPSPNLLILVAVLLSCRALVFAEGPFRPPEVISATDAQYPIHSVADGIVVLDVSLDERGSISKTKVTRDIPSLTPVAVSSVRLWKFSPAVDSGHPVMSQARVAFAFRPPAIFAAQPAFNPVSSSENSTPAENGSAYVPPGIVSATYPQYPVNAAMPGAVVVQINIGPSGRIRDVKVVRDLPPFTQLAVSAARKWQFQPATLQGQPIDSTIAVSFVFSAPRGSQ